MDAESPRREAQRALDQRESLRSGAASARMVTFRTVPVDVKYLDYEPLGFLSWGLREDGELTEQRAFDRDTEPTDIFALYTLDNEALRADFTAPWVIVSAIRPMSAMEIGSTGFSCGEAEIVALARSPIWGDDEKRAAELTAQRYGVPLVEFDRLAAVASEHGSPVPEDDRLPSHSEPRQEPRLRAGPNAPEHDRLDGTRSQIPRSEMDSSIRSTSHESSRQSPTEAVSTQPSAPSRAPPRARLANVTSRASVLGWTFAPGRTEVSNWLAYCALGAALVALGVGTWLLGKGGWPSGSLAFLLPPAVAIALASGPRLRVAISVAIAGVLAALFYLLVAAGSSNTPEEAQVRFAMLVVAWFVTATALACALAAAASRACRSLPEHLAALAAVFLPAGGLLAIGLLNLSAGIGALFIAAVELACLLLWDQAIKREARRTSG